MEQGWVGAGGELDEIDRALESARRRGDHRAVVSLAERALATNPGRTRAAIEAAQAQRRAGRFAEARAWLESARVSNPDPHEVRLLELEHAWLGLVGELAFDEAIECAERTLAELDGIEADDAAEPRWLATRVLLSAAAYRALDPERAAAVRRTLRTCQRELVAAGRADLVHEVARERAARVAPRHRDAAWAAVARQGERDALPEATAAALLGRARAARETGCDIDTVSRSIDDAERAFALVGHRSGPLEVERERALLAFDRGDESTARLEAVVDAFVAAGEPLLALAYLGELAVRAQERGDGAALRRTHASQRSLAGAHGLALLRISGDLSAASLAMLVRDDALARDVCDEALGTALPPGLRASFLAARGSAHAFAGQFDASTADRRAAIDTFVAAGAEDAAADIVEALVSDISRTRRPEDLDAAERLLVDWTRRDRARGAPIDARGRDVRRAELRTLRILGERGTGTSSGTREAALTDEGLALLDGVIRRLDQGDATGASDRARTRLRAQANQSRAFLLSGRGDVAGSHEALARAAADYDRARLPLQGANCRYLRGCSALNLAGAATDAASAAHAEDAFAQLSTALAFFDGAAGMRVNAAETRRQLALLALNVSRSVPPEALPGVLDECGRWLDAAAEDLEAVRRDYSAASRRDGLEIKARRAAEAMAVDGQALRLHLHARPDPVKAWRWATRSKARALVDLLGQGVEVPPALKAVAADDAVLRALIDEERNLATRLADGAASERRAIAADLGAVRRAMGARPELADYLLRRTGGSPTPDDLDRIGERAPGDVALVDWVIVADAVHLMIARPRESPRTVRLAGALSAARGLVAHTFGTSGDTRRALTSGARQLEELGWLVAPLARLARPGEHLILCPTGPLHAVPFQLLELGGTALLERHPIARTSSLGLLRLACERSVRASADAGMDVPVGAPSRTPIRHAEVFGDPLSDRPDARAAAEHVAAALGVVARIGPAATAASFERALAEASLVLYQGHATHEGASPLDSRLLLAQGERLDVRRLLELPEIACRSLVLGACESGRSEIRPGDEPLGLLAALLAAGVATVTAADWAVHAGSARALLEIHAAKLLGGERPIEALREAALAVREMPGYRAPYHWGAFTVHGDPWRRVQERQGDERERR